MRYLAALVLLVLAPPALAQPLPAGQWIGELLPQATQGRRTAVQAGVSRCDGQLALALFVQGQADSVAVAGLSHDPAQGHLSFQFPDPATGVPFQCRLQRIGAGQYGGQYPDGTYGGRCFVGSEPRYLIVLRPPAQPGPDCPEAASDGGAPESGG